MSSNASNIEALLSANKDPVSWVSDTLFEFASKFPKGSRILASPTLDAHLQSIQATLELEQAEKASSVDTAHFQMTQNLCRIKTEASSVVLELSACRCQLKTLLEKLRSVGADQLPSLHILSEVDALKRRLSACHNVFTEIQQWEVRARELELLLKAFSTDKSSFSSNSAPMSGEPAASSALTGLNLAVPHLVAMKDAASALLNLPQFEDKLQWLRSYENRLLDACRSRIRKIVDSNAIHDYVQCEQILGRLNCSRDVLVNGLSESFSDAFSNEFERQWTQTNFACQKRSVDTLHNESLHFSSEGEMLLNFYKAATGKLEQTNQLIRSTKADNGNITIVAALPEIIRKLLEIPISSINELTEKANENSDEALLSSIIFSMELGYSVVANAVFIGDLEERPYRSNTGGDDGKFWSSFCAKNGTKIFPIKLASSIALLHSRRLESLINNSPPLKSNWSPSQVGSYSDSAVSEAKHDAEKILSKLSSIIGLTGPASDKMQSSYDASFMVLESSSTLNTLEIQIASAVPELLSSVDDQLASYWKRWNSLLFLLENTVKARWDSQNDSQQHYESSSVSFSSSISGPSLCIDPAIQKPCIQLYQFLISSCKSAFLQTLPQLWRPALSAWLRRSPLNTSSRCSALSVASTKPPEYQLIVRHLMDVFDSKSPSASSVPPDDLLPKTKIELDNLIMSSREVAIVSVVYPVVLLLKDYAKRWSFYSNSSTITNTRASSVSLTNIACVGEYLVGALPLFDDDFYGRQATNNDESDPLFELVLHRVGVEFLNSVYTVSTFSYSSLHDLLSAARYIDRALCALGFDSKEVKYVIYIIDQWIISPSQASSITDQGLSKEIRGDEVFGSLEKFQTFLIEEADTRIKT